MKREMIRANSLEFSLRKLGELVCITLDCQLCPFRTIDELSDCPPENQSELLARWYLNKCRDALKRAKAQQEQMSLFGDEEAR